MKGLTGVGAAALSVQLRRTVEVKHPDAWQSLSPELRSAQRLQKSALQIQKSCGGLKLKCFS